MSHTKSALLFSLAVALSACGGGGGSDSSSGSSSTTQSTTVTENNHNTVAASTVRAVSMSVTSTNEATSYTRSSSDTSTSVVPGILAIATEQVQSMLAQSNKRAASSSTQACASGGTFTATSSIANSSYPSKGDSVVVSFSNCDTGAGFVTSGKLTLGIGDIVTSGSTLSGTMSAGFKFEDYSIKTTSSGVTNTYNGIFNMALTTNLGSLKSISFSAPSFSQVSSTGYTQSISNLAATASDFNSSANNHAYTFSCALTETQSGTVVASGLIGTVDPLVVNSSGTGITSGKLKFAGKDSAAFITFKANNAITLDLDSNGDGTIEKSWDTTIADINK